MLASLHMRTASWGERLSNLAEQCAERETGNCHSPVVHFRKSTDAKPTAQCGPKHTHSGTLSMQGCHVIAAPVPPEVVHALLLVAGGGPCERSGHTGPAAQAVSPHVGSMARARAPSRPRERAARPRQRRNHHREIEGKCKGTARQRDTRRKALCAATEGTGKLCKTDKRLSQHEMKCK